MNVGNNFSNRFGKTALNFVSDQLLGGSFFNNHPVTAIIRYLNHSLEELELHNCDVTIAKLVELRSMLKLKVFNCYHPISFLKEEEIKTLTNNLPHLIRPINEKKLQICDTNIFPNTQA